MRKATFPFYRRFRGRAWDVRRSVPASSEKSRGRGGARPSRSAHVSLRLSEARKALAEESLRHSTYKDLSAFLRGVSTGWDPRSPLAAKAGIVLCWAGAHLGTRLGPDTWKELQGLLRALLGTEDLGQSLCLAEKHVLSALVAKGFPKGSSEDPTLGLIGRRGPGREVRQRLAEGGKQSSQVAFKILGRRLHAIDRATGQEGFDNRSEYIRAVALGQNRYHGALVKGAATLFWARSHVGDEIGPAEWLRLDGLLREHASTYLFPSRCLPEISPNTISETSSGISVRDPEIPGTAPGGQSLWQAGAHLLASSPEAISAETGLPLS
jgi:hypothetical protein